MMTSYIIPILMIIILAVSSYALRVTESEPMRFIATFGILISLMAIILNPVEIFCHCGKFYHHFLDLGISVLVCVLIYRGLRYKKCSKTKK